MKIFVTGAGGCIGGRIVEAMHLTGWACPIAGVRSWRSAARVARFPVEIALWDVTDEVRLPAQLRDAEAVVHCASGNARTIVEGTRRVLEASLRSGVRRVLVFSSVDVYGATGGKVNEDNVCRPGKYWYAKAKHDVERMSLNFVNRGLEIVIFRPTLVYGPFSKNWTIDFAMRLLSGGWGLYGAQADGICNLVYVDDVVRAVMKALEEKRTGGGIFNINGAELCTWNEFFQAYNDALGLPPLGEKSGRLLRAKANAIYPVRIASKWVLDHSGDLVTRLYRGSQVTGAALRRAETTLHILPTPKLVDLFRCRAEYQIHKAQEVFGYQPSMCLRQGLSECAQWLRHHRLAMR